MKKFIAKYLRVDEGVTGTYINIKGVPYPTRLFLCEGDTKIALLSKEAKWVKEGDEFNEDEVQMVYGCDVTKFSTNNKHTHTLKFYGTSPEEYDVEDKALHWGEHIDGAGHGNGYRLEWDAKVITLLEVKVKCDKCETFH